MNASSWAMSINIIFLMLIITPESSSYASSHTCTMERTTTSDNSNDVEQCKNNSGSNVNVRDAEYNDNGNDNEDGCTLFIAPSIIPNSGLGLYTTKGYSKSDVALHDLMPDISIPYGVPYEEDADDLDEELKRDELLGGLRRYDWTSPIGMDDMEHMYAPYEEGTTGTFEFWPGFGSIANADSYYQNIDFGDGPYDDNVDVPLFDQQSRPHLGSDSFSPYHHKYVETTQPILEGGEIFVSYGDGFFLNKRNNPYWFVPLDNDYEEAKSLMVKFYHRYKDKIQNIENASNDKETYDLHSNEDKKQNIPSGISSEEDNSSLQEEWDKFIETNVTSARVKTALTKNVTRLMETKGLEYELGINQRPVDWIRKEGICIDRVQIGVSNIYEAGRGIFAKQHISKDTIILPVPVIQVNRTLQELNYNNDNKFIVNGNKESLPSHRLFVNYCFGHEKSSLLLCPYISQALLVNHSNDPSKVNAMVVLSQSKYVNRTMLSSSSNKLLEHDRTQRSLGIVFDIVATRDILPNEEIYIHYGSNWQNAWDQHVQLWFDNNFIDANSSHNNNNIPKDSNNRPTLKVALPDCVVSYNETNFNEEENVRNNDGTHDSVVSECLKPFIHSIIQQSPLERHYDTPSTGCFYYPHWYEDKNLLSHDEALTMQEENESKNISTSNLYNIKAYPWRYEYYFKEWMDDRTNGYEDDDDKSIPLIKSSTVGGLYPCHVLAQEVDTTNNNKQLKEEYYTVLVLIDHDSANMDGLDYDIIEKESKNDVDDNITVTEFYNQGKYTRRQVQLVKHVPAKALRHGMTQKWRNLSIVDHSKLLYNTIRNNHDDNRLPLPPPSPKPFRHYIGVPDDVFPDAWKDL